MRPSPVRAVVAVAPLALVVAACSASAPDAPAVAVAQAALAAAAAPGTPDVGCILAHCGGPALACIGETACNAALNCTKACPTADADAQQRCNIQCLEGNPSTKFDDLTKCLVGNKCITPRPRVECALPRGAGAVAKVSLSDLDGAWYVVRGLSRAYDCWPCQKMTFAETTPTTSHYDYAYDVVAGRTSHIDCHLAAVEDAATPPSVVPGRFAVHYDAHGIPGDDDWYVLSRPSNDYALIYYCGETPMANYRGAVAISRKPSTALPDDVAAAFAKALAGAGLATPVTLGDFCTPDNGACAP